ncbi:MAG: S49 family peptidase [Thermoguttaceae bacterium]
MAKDSIEISYPRIMAEIASTQWAIMPAAMDGILKAIVDELSSDDRDRFHLATEIEHHAVTANMGTPVVGARHSTVRNGIGILKIDGPIVPRASGFANASGLASIENLSSEFAALEKDPSIKSIVLFVDSPGGVVKGVSDFSKQIAASSKETTAFVFGHAASAAYWIASAADKIVSSDTGLVGSIGVVLSPSASKDKDKIEIVSSQSPKKRLDASSDEGRAEMQKLVDKLADVFVSAVADNRKVNIDKVLSDFGQGGMVTARDALECGMIDAVSTFSGLLDGISSGESQQDLFEAAERAPLVVQTLIFDKKFFTTRESAVKWAREHNYRADKVDETENSWRLRQRNPNEFARFVSKVLTQGVTAVMGPLKNPTTAEDNTETPADAGSKGETTMDLKSLMAEHPHLSAEIDAIKKAAFEAGEHEGTSKINARVEAAAPYLSSDAYSAEVRDMATQVIKGESDVSSLQMIVKMHDMLKAKFESREVSEESANIPSTPGQQIAKPSEDGTVATEEQFMMELAAAKRAAGKEVN